MHFLNIFKGLSMMQVTQIFLEGDTPTLKFQNLKLRDVMKCPTMNQEMHLTK